MLHNQLRNLRSNWPMWFTAGVAVYFLLSALGIPERLPAVGSGSSPDSEKVAAAPDSESKPSSTTTTSVSDASLTFKVKAFRLSPNTKKLGTLNAELTLEVANGSKSNAKFNTGELMLKRGGTPVANSEETSVTVSPMLPVIVPTSFKITPKAEGNYELLYKGRTIYSGHPF